MSNMSIDENLWINDYHGLELYPWFIPGTRGNENGILFLCQYYLLKHALGGLTDGDVERFNKLCFSLRSYTRDGSSRYDGLFDRGSDESKLRDSGVRTISHDNLTAISRFSNSFGLRFADEIAKHGLRNWMMYDNEQPWAPRLLYKETYPGGRVEWTSRLSHPRDWHYWLYLGGHKLLSLPTYPLFAISNILSCFGNSTSGKLLMFTRLFNRKEIKYKLIWKICSFLLTRKYGKNWLSAITTEYYHQRIDNPIRVLARELEEKQLLK